MGWKSTIKKIIAVFTLFAILVVALYALAMSIRKSNINYYERCVREYKIGNYETARDGFLDLLRFRDDIFPGPPPTDYINSCNEKLHSDVIYCPYCGRGITPTILEDAHEKD